MLVKKYLNGVRIYSINEERLMEKLKKIFKKIKKDKPEVKNIIVFGSFIKGNYTPFSDIDIAIILKESKKNFLERQDDFIDYFVNLPMDTNLLIYTEEEFKKLIEENNFFVKEILKGKDF